MRANVVLAALVCGLFVVSGNGSALASKSNPRPRDSFSVCSSTNGTDTECDGAICYCCVEWGTKGCWICESDETNCHWDPALRHPVKNFSPGVLLPGPKAP